MTFHDAKGHLGVDQPQSRKAKAVERTAPTGLLLYSLIVLWHECIRQQPARAMRPWPERRGASLADMLAALRRDCLEQTQETHLSTPDIPPGVQKILKPLTYLLALAA